MRRIIGVAILVVGVGGLGVFATIGPAAAIQAKITEAATAAVADAVHGIDVQVSGRDITVSGLAQDAAEVAALSGTLDAIPGRRVVSLDGLQTIPTASPFALTATKGPGGINVSGVVPTPMLRDIFGDSVTLANGAPDAAWGDVANQTIAALIHLQEGEATLSDTTLQVTGIAATPDDIAAFNAAIADLPAGYTASVDLAATDDGKPFSLNIVKTADGVTASGKIPTDFTIDMADGLLSDAAFASLEAAVVPDSTGVWPGIAVAGFDALAGLDAGSLTIEGASIALSGDAMNPDARAAVLAALDGYDARTEIALLDDGAPLRVVVTYGADTGAALSGKLPVGVTPSDVATMLDLEVAEDGVTQSILPAAADLLAPLATLRDSLPELNALTYTATVTDTQLDAVALPGVDTDRLMQSLQQVLGDSADVSVTAPTELPALGATRVNRFNGRTEVFTAGNWLPTFDFFATPESCTEQSDMVLADDQVQFLAGSAELDVQSIRAINAIAGLARKCAIEGGVFLEVAGHTDNTGDPAANQALSQARADTVRDALLARGLAQVVVSANGYGGAQPIADNDTEEGRAANRRTAFIWNFE